MHEDTQRLISAALKQHTAIGAAWQQLSAEDLAVLLREMPPKVRNRVLSRHRTPSSKVTTVTGRLLKTNLARRGAEERVSAASVITHMLRHAADDAVDDTAGAVVASAAAAADESAVFTQQLVEVVRVECDRVGAPATVFAAVTSLYAGDERDLVWFAACARADILPETLAPLAADLEPLAADAAVSVLEAARDGAAAEHDEAAQHDEAAEHEAGEQDEAAGRGARSVSRGGSDGDGPVGDDVVEVLAARRDAARLAAASAVEAIEAGRTVDVDALVRYSDTLRAAAERLGVDATVSAVVEAVEADSDAALRERMGLLQGPAHVDSDLRALRDVVSGPLDAATRERIERFARLLDTDDPMERFTVADALSSLPDPPSPRLVQAALAGALSTAPVPGGRASEPEAATAATAQQADGESPRSAADVNSHAPASAQPALDEAITVRRVEPDAEAVVVAAGHAGTGSSTASELEAPTSSGGRDHEHIADAASDASDAAANESQEGAGSAAEPVDGAGPGADTDDDVAAEAAAVRASRSAVAAEADLDDDVDADSPAVDAAATADRDVQGELTSLVRSGRFGLAHHLARLLDQPYRATVLAEAALADVVRDTVSPAAADMVERVASTASNDADTGAVLLRTASLVRVSLLDPASGAPTLLRGLFGALERFPQLTQMISAVTTETEQGLVVPASGVVAEAADAIEQAHAVALWAEETLSRPPRANRLFRGVEIWKAWVAPGGALGEILALVAADDPNAVERVRALCARFARSQDIQREIRTADDALRADRLKTMRITGPAREQLRRNVSEVVSQALAWCNAKESARSGWGAKRRSELAEVMLRLRSAVTDELGVCASDEWSAAAAYAAAKSLDRTCGLFAGEALPGVDLDPVVALHRELGLADGFRFDAELHPVAAPTVEQVLAAANRWPAAAFDARLAAEDFAVAESILELPWARDALDLDAASARLVHTERASLAAVSAQFRSVDDEVSKLRARSRISQESQAQLAALIHAADPQPKDREQRRDLGAVRAELAVITDTAQQAVREHRAAVTDAVHEAIAANELTAPWKAKLAELLERDELGAVEEYLHRALAGEPAPTEQDAVRDKVLSLTDAAVQIPDGITAELIAVLRRGDTGALDFSDIDDQSRSVIAAALEAWLELSRNPRRPDPLEPVLFPVLGLLGLVPNKLERPGDARDASNEHQWFVDVYGDRSGNAYVPDYGSRANGRRRFLLCWNTSLPMRQLWDLAASNAVAQQPVYVLWMGMLSVTEREQLAAEARRRRSGNVVVIDDAVLAQCAQVAQQSFDVTMRLVLPYAAPNPYDPEMLANTPEEMFYGRNLERQKVAQFSGGTSFISGGRRLGKSALLSSVKQQLERTSPETVALYILIQNVAAAPPYEPAELWPRVATRLADAGVLPEGTPGTGDAVATGIRRWLADNPERRLLLLLDECDFFLRADSMVRFENVVLLRDLMSDSDTGSRFKVVFSGLQHVARYRKLPNQPLSHLPPPLVIGPLDPESAAKLVRRPLHALGWNINDTQVDQLVTFCAFNPSVLQLACCQLVDRLRRLPVGGLAPWNVPDEELDDLLRAPELHQGVRDRLFLTLELDHSYKLVAYLMAQRAHDEGLAAALTPSALRAQAAEYWPDGFAHLKVDDVRALCDELVGLGVFAGDAESGYRMLTPATVRLFGTADEIADELLGASDTYESEDDITTGAAGHRDILGEGRFSPLTAQQLSDVLGLGATQLRVVFGTRAMRTEFVPLALSQAVAEIPNVQTRNVESLRDWRDAMSAPSNGHRVVIADVTRGIGPASWEDSLGAARRRGVSRSGRGSRAAVLITGPVPSLMLPRFITGGDLEDVTVVLRRVTPLALRAWDRIEDLNLTHPQRQHRLLEVTGGWPLLVEQVLCRMPQQSFDDALAVVEARLADPDGAQELIAAVGLDPYDPAQPADPVLLATVRTLVRYADEYGWNEPLAELAQLLEEEDEPVPAAASVLSTLQLLGVLDENDDGSVSVEPVVARCVGLVDESLHSLNAALRERTNSG